MLTNEEIAVALNSQDEIDKKDVSLYGVKGGNEKASGQQMNYNSGASNVAKADNAKSAEGKKGDTGQAEPIIQLHKPCLNCAQPTSMILDLYKLACLAYAPSPVMFNGEEKPRRFYLDRQFEILK